MFEHWLQLMQTATETTFAAQRVVALRMMRLAGGGAAASREAQRMVLEKIAVAAEANLMLLSGAGPHSVTKRYRRAVRANERRLSKPKK